MQHAGLFRPQLQRLWVLARRRVVILGLMRAGAVALPALVLTLWVAGAPHLTGHVLLLGLGLSFLALALALMWSQVIVPWRSLRSPRVLAGRIESHLRCRNLVLAATDTQQQDMTSGENDPITRELWARVLAGGEAALQRVRLAELFPLPQARGVASGLVAGAILLLLVGLYAPQSLKLGAKRLWHPLGARQVIPRGGIYLLAGPEAVIAGQAATLVARDFGGGDDGALCQIKMGAGTWQDLTAREVHVASGVPGRAGPFRQWSAIAEGVQEDFEWRFRRGERLSPVGRVQVWHHPLLTKLGGRVVPPAYTQTAPHDLDILPATNEIPLGGMLQLSGTTGKPVVSAVVALVDGDSLPMTVEGYQLQGELSVTGEMSFQIVLRDEHGLTNLDPLTYKIIPLADQKPRVRLERPDDDGILPLGGEIRLVVEVADDFGLRNIRLLLRPQSGREVGNNHEGWQGGQIWPGDSKASHELSSHLGPWQVKPTRVTGEPQGNQARVELTVDLSLLALSAGEGVELVAVARDNREPGVGQATWSDVLRLVLPSAGDVLVEQAASSAARRSELVEARAKTRKLGQDLDRLTRELMKNPTPDWARQQEMEEVIARKRDLQKQLAAMSSRLQEELDRLAANQMTSERQLAQADQVTSLLEQQENRNLDGLLERMEQRPEAMDPQDVAQALREVARNQKDLARRLDAALAMLKKMDQEQELDGMAALLEKIMREQQDLAEQSRELADEQKKSSSEQNAKAGEQSQEQQSAAQQQKAEDLAARQDELAQDLEQMQQKMEQALEDAKKQGDTSGEEQQMQKAMQDMLDQLKEQQAQDKMAQAGEQLQQMDPEQAAKMQEQALRDLGSLYHVLLKTQEAMQMAMEQNQVASLRGLAADMLDLSRRQEDIAQRIPSQLRDVRIQDLARSQHRMQQVAMGVREKLSGLSTDVPLRILALLKKLDSLIEVMGYGVNALEEGQGSAAQHQSREALVQANNMIIGLLTEAQMNSSGGGGGSQSKPSLAEKLMQMIKEQAGLNGTTDELRKMLANRGLSQKARAQMQRLGEAQGDLAGRMDDLAAEERLRPDSGRLLGDLAQLGQDMESITADLGSGMVSEDILRRQERILSRMLDARNSVRRRDYSMRRESRTAQRTYGDHQQGSLTGDEDQRRFRLRYQALDSAPADYQSLVRQYFSALDSLQQLGETRAEPGVTP